MKRLKPALAVGLVAIFVGSLLALAWFGVYFFNRYLNSPHTYGTVEVIPVNHHSSGIFTHSWDSLQIKAPGFKASLRNVKIDFDPAISLQKNTLSVSADTFRTFIEPEAFPTSNDTTPFSVPDIRLPIRVRIHNPRAEIHVKNIGSWTADSILLQSQNETSAELSFRNGSGKFVEQPVSGALALSWQGDFLSAKANFKTPKDSLSLLLNAPRKSPQDFSGTANLLVNNPRTWVKDAIPEVVSLKNIRVKSDFHADPRKSKFSFLANVKANLGAIWPLPALAADINIQGNEKQKFNIHGKFSGKKSNQEIAFRGNVDKNLHGEVEASIRGLEAEFGPRIQPLNGKVRATKSSDNLLIAHAVTEAGSIVDAKISGLSKGKKFHIAYTGDIAVNEPWAVRWSGEHLKFGNRPQVTGSFQDGKMRADVSIAPVEYAYFMTADSFYTSLLLDKRGIDFDKGFIRAAKDNFTFTGDVKWKDSIPHTSWEVHQSDSGYAKAFITFEKELTSEAHAVILSRIPFADTNLFRGFDGKISGTFQENFETFTGQLEAEGETQIAQTLIRSRFKAHNTLDSLVLDRASITTGKNVIDIEASALLTYDSIQEKFTNIQLADAWASTNKFDIPLLFSPYEKSPLSSGIFSGNVSFRKGLGIQGTLQFSDLALKNISREDFSIPRLDVFAEKEKMQISGNLSAGEGLWNGDIQIDVNGLLNPSHHIFAYFSTPVGGTLWLDGDIDSTFKWNGKTQLSGSWFLPGNMGEVVYTDFKADASGDLHHPLDSLELSFVSDSTAIDTKRGFPILPVSFSGKLQNGIFQIPQARLENQRGEFIQAEASYDLKNKKLGTVNLETEKFSLVWNQIHEVGLNRISGQLTDSEKEFTLSLKLDSVSYRLNKPDWGKADASAHGTAVLHLPHAVDGSFANSTVEANILLDRAVYKNEFSVDLGFGSISKISATLSSFFTRIRRSKVAVRKTAAKSRPMNLSIHISDSQRDTVAILTNLANFPITADLWILGTSDHPLFRGDVNNSGNGTIGLEKLFQFNLESFAVSFQDVPWNRGTVNISSVQNLPYCRTNDNRDNDETCPVHLDILGSIVAPKPMPSANCGVDDSPASLYYSVLLGCISDEESSTIDRNKVAGKLIGSVLTSTANKTLGGDYVGDIDMKIKLFDEETIAEKDSSYLMIPISLDRWVKDLSLVFGYKQDQSETPTYDRALEAGLTYIIPAFSEEDKTKNPEHYNSQLDFSANLVQKNYITTSDNDESRLEKNIGFNYSYQFWSPCLLGLGKCAPKKSTRQEVRK